MGRISPFTKIKDNYLQSIDIGYFSLESYRNNFPECDRSDAQVRSRRNSLTGGLRRKNVVREYSNHVRKRYIQDKIMRNCGVRNCDISALLGPTHSDYLNLLYSNGIMGNNSVLHSYEINSEIYNSQLMVYNHLSNIELNFRSIENAKLCKYMDIDLTCSYKSCGSMLNKLFSESRLVNEVFNFSFSINRIPMFEVYNVIENSLSSMLGVSIELENKFFRHNIGNNKFIKEFLINKVDGYSIKIYHYSDSSPMLSFSIVKNSL